MTLYRTLLGHRCTLMLTFALASTLISYQSYAESDRALRIAFNDFPPYAIQKGHNFEAYSGQGCHHKAHTGFGIDPDFLISVLEHAGLSYELLFLPYSRVKLMLHKGAIDASAGFFYVEEDNQPKYRYIFYDIGGETIFYAKRKQAEKLTELEQLFSLKLAIVRGDTFHNKDLDSWIYESKRLKPFLFANSYEQLFRQLEADRVDVIALNNVVGGYMMKTLNIPGIKASPLRLTYGENPKADGIHIAMRKDTTDNIFERVDTSAKILIEQGIFKCIQAKYGVLSNH
ncbi:substrate-binding periplasmic protein [Alkalimarinus coralli]|uniref:substrate-binding periplasmic protein n=1 Tax=Alkalimarinus coralli TaxID=2935863 RepID=UPI00202AD13D|nr:transporter substrate-binding domain-containing protein [Alkalimarinus coralli]